MAWASTKRAGTRALDNCPVWLHSAENKYPLFDHTLFHSPHFKRIGFITARNAPIHIHCISPVDLGGEQIVKRNKEAG
ncbi:MAG TPA: hypothetical protein VMD05_02275 [Candidatus Nanoarchaeia archaeon]|nr:hypothetical protein [Candidatus Nanoarchaeia archaeon]